MFAHLASLCNFKRFLFLVSFDPLEDDNYDDSNNSSNYNSNNSISNNSNNGSSNNNNNSNNNDNNSNKKMSKNAWLEFFNKPGVKIEVKFYPCLGRH